MTNKDIRLLQEIYDDVRTDGEKDISVDSEVDQQEGSKFGTIEIGLGRTNPSVEQGDLLQGLSENDARELLNHLNQKGEENEEYWVLKDNLILQLFDLLKNPNI
jgi:hypothetical protein